MTLTYQDGGPLAEPEALECEGHPAGPFDPMGETVYCDGSCRAVSRDYGQPTPPKAASGSASDQPPDRHDGRARTVSELIGRDVAVLEIAREWREARDGWLAALTSPDLSGREIAQARDRYAVAQLLLKAAVEERDRP